MPCVCLSSLKGRNNYFLFAVPVSCRKAPQAFLSFSVPPVIEKVEPKVSKLFAGHKKRQKSVLSAITSWRAAVCFVLSILG